MNFHTTREFLQSLAWFFLLVGFSFALFCELRSAIVTTKEIYEILKGLLGH